MPPFKRPRGSGNSGKSGRPPAGRGKSNPPGTGGFRPRKGPSGPPHRKPFSGRKKEGRGAEDQDHPDPGSLRPFREHAAAGKVSRDMPLNKFIAQCGISSRRKAADLVKEGKVTVDGVPVTEPATRVTGREEITLEGKRIRPHAEMVYVLLNKPRGYITSLEDPQGRKTVMELVRGAANTRIYPVGRLDRNTSGLLLLTNDGELAQKLAHPSFEAKKVYQVTLDKPLTQEDYRKILTGVELEDGLASVDAMEYLDAKDGRELGLEIHLGRNRIVRRIFEHLGYNVEKLDRVMYAGLTKKQLPRGTWRLLGEKEVILLKYFK